MKLLLDTHALLWFLWDDARLPGHIADQIEELTNSRYFSVASIWELAIKVSTGKLVLAQPLDVLVRERLPQNSIELVPIELSHVLRVASLPMHHRDPFDRLLIAQSLEEAIPLVSADPILDAYGIQRIW